MSETHEQFLAKFQTSRDHIREAEKDEILLIENKRRFVMFPIKYHEIWAAYKKVEAAFWTAEETELAKDLEDIKTLSKEQLDYFGRFLATLAVNEKIINYQVIEKFSAQLQSPEGKSVYGFEIMMENIYDEVYSMIVDAYYNGPENVPFFKEVKTQPELVAKADFMNRWIRDSGSLYGERLVALAVKEAIFMAGGYTAVFDLASKHLCPGFTGAATKMYRDKGAYTDFSCLLFAHLRNKPEAKIIEKIITEAVDIEKAVVSKALVIKDTGLDEKLVYQYIEFIADSLLSSFGNDKIYNVNNPFEFMEGLTSIGKSRFFEKQVADFMKANAPPQQVQAAQAFNFDESF